MAYGNDAPLDSRHNDVPMDSQYMDYAEHERTYRFFLGLTKWGSISVVIILILMAFFLI